MKSKRPLPTRCSRGTLQTAVKYSGTRGHAVRRSRARRGRDDAVGEPERMTAARPNLSAVENITTSHQDSAPTQPTATDALLTHDAGGALGAIADDGHGAT